ncbi:MAG TPA: hypothetical protein VEH10_04465 [Thermoplasmata archaeon]|nr:hypothetical protein [Thermoplasmata archaeon]
MAGVVPSSSEVGGLGVLATIAVGGLPQFAAYDAANGDIYVPNWANGNVSVINGTTVVATVPAGGVPFSATYDPSNHEVYVVNEASDNVTVLSGTSVVANVAVGTTPQFATYDASNSYVYVSNTASASVTVLNGSSVVTTLPVGNDPSRVVVGSSSGGGGGGGWLPAAPSAPAASGPDVFVPNSGSNSVTIFGGTSGTTFLATVGVGSAPQFSAWDPGNAWLYVPNNGSNNVSVLSSTSPYKVLYTVPVGTDPFSASYNSSSGHVFVVNWGSSDVSVLGGALTTTVTATIPVGSEPEFLSQDPGTTTQYLVPNTGSHNVSIITATGVVGSLAAGAFPVVGTADPFNHDVYVQNFDSANVTVLGPVPPAKVKVTFTASGLPAGATFGVTAGDPPTTNTSNGTASTSFLEPSGVLNTSFHPPTGFSVAKVKGPKGTTTTSTFVPNHAVVLTVEFVPVETLSFTETGLSAGTFWQVNLSWSSPHGPPDGDASAASFSGSSAGGPIEFNVTKGTWSFVVTVPHDYKATPSKGSVGATHELTTKKIRFALVTSKVVFSEHGLTKGTVWGVNITGSANHTLVCAVSGAAPSVKCLLESGNYTFVVHAEGGFTAAPSTGTLTVAAPVGQVVKIAFTGG